MNLVCKRIAAFFGGDEFQGKFQERFDYGKITPIKGVVDKSKWLRAQNPKEKNPFIPCVEIFPNTKAGGVMRDMEELSVTMQVTIPTKETQAQMDLQPEGYYDCNYNDDLEIVTNFMLTELSKQMTLGAVLRNWEIDLSSAFEGYPVSVSVVTINFMGNPATLGGG